MKVEVFEHGAWKELPPVKQVPMVRPSASPVAEQTQAGKLMLVRKELEQCFHVLPYKLDLKPVIVKQEEPKPKGAWEALLDFLFALFTVSSEKEN